MDLPEYLRPTEEFNIPLARKVLEFAEQEHDDFEFNMDNWFTAAEYLGKKKLCNTTACLAGTAALLAPNAEIDGIGMTIDGDWYAHEDGGAILLGLSSSVVDYLFYFDTNERALDTLRAMIKYAEAHEDSL